MLSGREVIHPSNAKFRRQKGKRIAGRTAAKSIRKIAKKHRSLEDL
jgi:hypothetical protein